ncbi:MAG TPA: YdeI/OmpD-associated family protein [Candidatus Paceibacterota bacterium]|nr:YdeI/OmpD-associated family protein [Candidatus Paceibacterota bacterium]
MTDRTIPGGTAHRLPADMRAALFADRKALDAWETLTPLARNEWICWTVSVKKQETRDEHLERLVDELKEGKRRPCCWIGCIHRKDKEISPSVRGVLGKRAKKSD